MPRTRNPVILVALLSAASATLAADIQSVRFNAADGTQIFADYCRAQARQGAPAAPIVIILHETTADRRASRPLYDLLQKAGFAVLALDLRGCGESSSTETKAALEHRDPKLYDSMQDDLRGAYDWLAQRPEHDRARFALVAAGDAAALALQYAAKDVSVDAIVCLSPVLELPGCDALGDVRQITGRSLLLIGDPATQDACEKIASLNQGAKKRAIESNARGTALVTESVPLGSEIVAFLKNAVGRSNAEVVCCSIESDKGIYHDRDSGWVKRIAPSNLRMLSSKQEAESRGLRAARSMKPGDKSGKARPADDQQAKKPSRP